MVKICKFIIFVFLASTMSSCKSKCDLKVLIAKKDVDVYDTHEQAPLKKIFSIHPGDQCAAGEIMVEKMFGYVEVLCPGKGYGWVILGDGYVIINKDNVYSNK